MRQGLGISVMTRDAELLFPDLRCVLPELDPIPVPIWLVTHRELRTSPRIRVVFDLLAEEIGRGYYGARGEGPACPQGLAAM